MHGSTNATNRVDVGRATTHTAHTTQDAELHPETRRRRRDIEAVATIHDRHRDPIARGDHEHGDRSARGIVPHGVSDRFDGRVGDGSSLGTRNTVSGSIDNNAAEARSDLLYALVQGIGPVIRVDLHCSRARRRAEVERSLSGAAYSGRRLPFRVHNREEGTQHVVVNGGAIVFVSADLALRPTSITAVEAASLPLVALTAWQALVAIGNVQPGQKVLIHAGAGGVGSIAIQLAKHLGAYVATTASASNSDFVNELGADLVIDYRAADFETQLNGYDFVLDSLGGENLEKSLRILRPGGKAVGISGPPTPAFAKQAGMNPLLRAAIAALSRKIRRQARKAQVSYDFLFMQANGEQLTHIAALVDASIIRPIVERTFPFDATPEALKSLSSGGTRGKTVVVVG